jgi:hypothetical protein
VDQDPNASLDAFFAELNIVMRSHHAFALFLQEFIYSKADNPINILEHGNGTFNNERVSSEAERTE